MPKVNTPYRLKILKDVNNANDAGLAIVLGLLGLFTMMTWYFLDFSDLTMALFMDPDLYTKLWPLLPTGTLK